MLRKLIFSVLILFSGFLAKSQDIIMSVEYYIDIDPGVGSGTPVTFTSGTDIDIDVNIPTGSLSVGMHVLVVRVMDINNDWGIHEVRPFYVAAQSLTTTESLTDIEYYFDTDPGYGNGTSFSILSSTDVTVNDNVDVTSLTNGFHVMHVRAQDSNGSWSLPDARPFYVINSSLSVSENIVELEYFIDTDPGFGNGTDISISAATAIDVNELIATNALTHGFHVIHFRARDSNGIWGLVESRAFFVSTQLLVAQANIVELEYFIDNDPGFGNGTDIPISTAASIDVDELISTTPLSPGFHVIHFRARDSDNTWGLVDSRPFFVSTQQLTAQANTVELEYYIDTDPGFGAGTEITITPGTSFDILEQIPTTSLTPGFHVIHFRTRDDDNAWSIPDSRPFFVTTQALVSNANVASLEYFVDTDPGFGNGTDITITPGNAIDINALIPTGSLSLGFHVLHFRTQDNDGTWGVTDSRPFFVSSAGLLTQESITNIEYYIDSDPGYGNGTPISFTSATDVDFIYNLPTGVLSVGFHKLFIRVRDSNGFWSLEESRSFYVNESFQITFVEYYVDNDPGLGQGTQVAVAPPSSNIDLDITVPTAALPTGNYHLGMRVKGVTGPWSYTQIIPFTVCAPPTADFDVNTVCLGTATTFSDASTTNAGDVYHWDFDSNGVDDDATAGSTTFTYPAPGNYTATLLIDRLGCTDAISVNVSVVAPPFADFSVNTVCAGSVTTFTDESTTQAGDVYSWDFTDDGSGDGATAGNTTHLYPGAGTYTATLTLTRSACTVETSATVNVSSVPDANFTTAPVCAASATTFTDLSSTMAGDVYNWDFENDGTTDNTTSGNTTFTYPSSGTFTAELTIIRGLCQDSFTANVQVVAIPIVSAGPDQSLCVTNATLAGSTPGAGETGLWTIVTGSGILTDSDNPSSDISNLSNFTTVLEWRVTNTAVGCNAADQVTITANQPITTQAFTNSVSLDETVNTVVQGGVTSNPGDVLTTTIVNQGTKGVASVAGNGSIDYSPNDGTVGDDVITYRVCNQCNRCSDNTLTITIENDPPVIEPDPVEVTDDEVVINLLSIISDPNNNLDPTSLIIVQQPSSGATASIDAQGNLIIDYTGIYFVGTDEIIIEVCDLQGICSSNVITLEVNLPEPFDPPISVFNALSPNGDGKHDVLEIENITAYPNNIVYIFNRWGDKVFEAKGYNNDDVSFTGTGNHGGAKELAPGTYYYSVDLGNGSALVTGFLVLKKGE